MKGVSGWVILIVIVLLLYAWNQGMFAAKPVIPATTKVCPDGTVVAITAACPTVPGVTCPSTMQTTVKSTIQNPLAGTLSYVRGNLTFVDAADGSVKSTSDYTVGGASKSYSTGIALTCGKSYIVYTDTGTNASASTNHFAPCSKSLGVIQGDTVYNDMSCPNATEVHFRVFDSAYGNETNTEVDSGWTSERASTTSNTMGTGSTLTMIVRYRVNTSVSSGATFGSDELSTYVCADFELTVFSKTSGITVDRTDWVDTDLPKWCANAGYDKAWKIPTPKSTHGERDVKISFKADLGNPASDPRFYFVDEAYYIGNDGKIHYSSCNDAGTDLGQTNRFIDINLA